MKSTFDMFQNNQLEMLVLLLNSRVQLQGGVGYAIQNINIIVVCTVRSGNVRAKVVKLHFKGVQSGFVAADSDVGQ